MRKAIDKEMLEILIKNCTHGNMVDVESLISLIQCESVELPAYYSNNIDEVIKIAESNIAKGKETFVHTLDEVAQFFGISRKTLNWYKQIYNLSFEKYPAPKRLAPMKYGYKVKTILTQIKNSYKNTTPRTHIKKSYPTI